MRRTRAPNNVAVIPAMSDSETGGYYDDGPPATIWSKDDANIIQEELVALATLKGAALDTTGATRTQCATAVDAVLGMEAKGAETANVSTVWKHAVIASSTAEVGETADSVEHTLVAASSASKAKGHQTAVIASTDAQAGLSAGTTEHAAVIATNFMSATGDASAVIACTGDTDPGVSGRSSAALASEGDGNLDVSGNVCAAIATMNPVVEGDLNAAIATTSALVAGTESAVIGGSGNQLGSSCVGAGTFACKNVKVNAAQAAAIAATCDTASDEVTGTNALIAATSDSKAAGAQAAVIGGSLNESNDTGCVVIGSAYSKAVSAGNNNVVILASRGYESDVGTDAPSFSVAGGYDAGTPPTPAGRSWALESNGGNMRSTNAHTTSGLDYAEMFPNADGVPHAPGRLLARTGRAVRLAQSGDRIIGAVSVAPTVVGGDDHLGWQGRWLRDEWGAYVMAEVEEVELVRDDAAHRARAQVLRRIDHVLRHARKAVRLAQRAHRTEPTDATEAALAAAVESYMEARAEQIRTRKSPEPSKIPGRTNRVLARVVNPDYRPAKHTPRAQRASEWTCVGLIGQLRIAVDETVRAEDDVVAGKDGIGTRGEAVGRGAQVECMEIVSPYDEARGYAIAVCMVR